MIINIQARNNLVDMLHMLDINMGGRACAFSFHDIVRTHNPAPSLHLSLLALTLPRP